MEGLGRPQRRTGAWTPSEESCSLTEFTPTTYESKLLDDFHYSETTEIIYQEQSSDTVPSYLFDAELDDETIGRASSSPLFIQEREEPANRRQAYHSFEEKCCQLSPFLCVTQERGDPCTKLNSLSSCSRENRNRDSENEQIRILLERQKEQILADYRAEIQKHEFQADYDRRSIQELNGTIESQRGEMNRALEGDEQLRRYQQLLHEPLLEQNRELREARLIHLEIFLKEFHLTPCTEIEKQPLEIRR